MPLVPGTKLGPYEIGPPLGAGRMGEVYRARDTRFERTVAIKILPELLSCDPVRKQRFEREAKAISSLNHPHICVLHDVGSQDGISYLVMECVEGETLLHHLLDSGRENRTGSMDRPQPVQGESSDRKAFAYLQTEFDERHGRFSPDGRWVAYSSNESGLDEVYVQSFPVPGAKFLISAGGGMEPQWRKDGTELFYISENRTLMAVPVMK